MHLWEWLVIPINLSSLNSKRKYENNMQRILNMENTYLGE